MHAEIQFSTFTHGKCPQCKYLAMLDKFEHNKNHMTNSDDPYAGKIEAYILELTCPVCGFKNCEALFVSEIN